MGFTKLAKESERASAASKFVPSTKEDLKRYAKNGKKRSEDKAEGKAGRKAGVKLLSGVRRAEYREMFARHDKFTILADNTIRVFCEFCKECEVPVPRYKEYLPRKDADSEFVFDINHALSRMSWIQLSKIINDSVGYAVVTKEFTEAYNFAAHALLRLALGVTDKNGTYRLTDLNVLASWPVESRKRPSKEERNIMSKKEAALVASGKSKSKAAAEDEDEDEEAEEGDEDEEAEESDEEAEEEAPKKRSRSKSKAKDEEADDEEEEAAEEDEDEEEGEVESDEDDEDVGTKAARAKQSKRKRGKAAEDEDDSDDGEDDEDGEDEDDSDDAEDDEDDQPKKRTKSAKETTVKKDKADKTEKAVKGKKARPESMKLKGDIPKARKGADKPLKKGKAEKPASKKAEKHEKPVKEKAKVERGPRASDSTLFKVAKKFEGGVKEQAQAVIPKSGATMADIIAKCKKEHKFEEHKTKGYISWLARNGFLKKVDA